MSASTVRDCEHGIKRPKKDCTECLRQRIAVLEKQLDEMTRLSESTLFLLEQEQRNIAELTAEAAVLRGALQGLSDYISEAAAENHAPKPDTRNGAAYEALERTSPAVAEMLATYKAWKRYRSSPYNGQTLADQHQRMDTILAEETRALAESPPAQ